MTRPQWPKLANLAQKACTLYTFSSLVCSLLPKDKTFKKIFIRRELKRVIKILLVPQFT